MSWLNRNPDIAHHVNKIHAKKGERQETGGSLVALYMISYYCDKLDFEMFFDKLKSGAGIEKGSPILALRRFIANQAVGNKRTPGRVVQAVTIKAWNAYVEGASVDVLSYKAGGAMPEPFPKIICKCD
jgi:hypothetical protein